MLSQGARRDVVFDDGVCHQWLGKFRGFAMRIRPTDGLVAEDVVVHLQVEAGPCWRTL